MIAVRLHDGSHLCPALLAQYRDNIDNDIVSVQFLLMFVAIYQLVGL